MYYKLYKLDTVAQISSAYNKDFNLIKNVV